MARYIDADKALEEVNRIGGHNLCGWSTSGVKALIDRQTTADVVPKSEVAREIFEEIEKICTDFPLYGNLDSLVLSEHDFAELKKKYTEGKEDEGK